MDELISAPAQLAWPLALVVSPYLLPASLAFGLILFELGYRIKLRWLRAGFQSARLNSVFAFPRSGRISRRWPAPAW